LRVLVTGGAGFIGSHIVEFYSNRGDEVVALDSLARGEMLRREEYGIQSNWEYLRSLKNVTPVKGDIRDFEKLKDVAAGCEVIFHAAAQVAVTSSVTDPVLDFEINAKGTINVLEASRLHDASVVFTSTNKAYGENVNKIPVTEKEKRYEYADPKYNRGIPEEFPIDLTGHSPYGCSKLSADLYVQDYAHTYGLKTGVFRQSCIYGERQFGVEDQGWVAWFVIATLSNRPITIYGDGKQVRDVLYVKDLVTAFDAFLNSHLRHEVFNTGGGPKNTLSLLELLDILEEFTRTRPRISFSSWRPADQKVYVSDISKMFRLLHWKPLVGPQAGVKKLVEFFRKKSTS